MVERQKMFRVSRLKDHSLDKVTEDQIISELKMSAKDIDAILVSDFVYGVITPKILKEIKRLSKENKLKIFGDLQCSSQLGNITKFTDFDLITPTEREARIGLSNKDDSLEKISNLLLTKTGSKNLIMKLGSDGLIAYEKTEDGFINRQHFSALSVNPTDVTGAGDSLISAIAVAISSGIPFMEATAIGVNMASIAVETVGNFPIELSKLKKRLSELDRYNE